MGKVKNAVQKMSLKKSLVLLAVICLGTASVLSAVTIAVCSRIRQQISDTRPIIITGYVIEPESEYHVIPEEYSYGELSRENQIYDRIVTILMMGLPVLYIIVASLLVGKLYYKWKLQKPLASLKEGMSHISRQDLDFQMQYHSNDELGRLCDAFEQMKKEVYKSNRSLWDMLQERKALTASVSHDLRTPITVLRGYLDYLAKSMEREILTEENLQTTIRKMTEAADRLERYVDCVKDIQKIEDIEIKKETCDFREWKADRIREFSILAAEQKKQLVIHDLSKTQFIKTDKDMLSKILENIFHNAVRFSNERIVFTIEEAEEDVSFVIEDDGAGFAAEELEKAVTFFYTSPINGGNFGIGLSICKILCGKLNGVLHLENNAHHGARVTVKIKK